MVAAGMGVTLVPRLSVPRDALQRGAAAARATTPHPLPAHPDGDGSAAHAPRGAGLAPQLYPLRGDRRVAQCHLRLRTAGGDPVCLEVPQTQSHHVRGNPTVTRMPIQQQVSMPPPQPKKKKRARASTSALATKDRACHCPGPVAPAGDTYTLYLTTHNFHGRPIKFNTLHAMFMAVHRQERD